MENFNEQSVQQVDRCLRKIIQKFPATKEPSVITDIHLRISPESGDLMAFDDDDNELTRCVVEEWIENKDENFYDLAAQLLRNRLNFFTPEIDSMSLLKPFSFVLENEDNEHISELFISDDDINIIGGDLLDGWESDLDTFFDKLMDE